MIKLKGLLNEVAGKLSISQLPLDFIFNYPIAHTSTPGNFEDWYRDGMKLKKGRIEKFSPEDDKKLRSLINIWWDEYDDVPMADFHNGRDSKEIKKVKKDILDFLKQKSKVITEVVTEGPQKVGNVNALDPKAEKFLDAIQVNDRSIKDLKNITVDATPQGNWSVYYKGKRMFTLNGKMLDDKTIMKYGLEHMDESLSEGKKIQKSVNEAPQKVGNVNAFGASKVLGKGKKVLGFVPDTPNAVATLIQDFPQAMEIEFKQGFFSDGKLLKSIKKGDKVWKELEKRFLDTATKDTMKAGFKMNENKPSVTEKSDDVFSDYSSSKGKTKGRSFSVDRVVKDGKYSFESDDNDGTVRLSYNGKPISYGFIDWSTGGFIMIHSSWNNKDKSFQFTKDIIKYFKSKKITTETVTEAKVKTPTEIVTSVPATAIPPTNIPKAEVGLGLHMGDVLGRGLALTVRDYSLNYSNGKVALKLTSNGRMAVRVKSETIPDYVDKVKKVADKYLMDYAKEIKK